MSKRSTIAALRADNDRFRVANATLLRDLDRAEADALECLSEVRRLTVERDNLADRVADLIRDKQLGQFERVLQRALTEPEDGQ